TATAASSNRAQLDRTGMVNRVPPSRGQLVVARMIPPRPRRREPGRSHRRMDLDLLRSAVDWRDGRLEIVDQTLLPGRLVVLRPTTVAEVVDALRRLAVGGAPAIGVAGAFGVVLGLAEAGPPRPGPEGLAAARADLRRAADALAGARPTAVNLRWAVRRVVAAAAGAGDA